MTDPVTNVAIEDVLSSIRRLVSEDARVRPVGFRAEVEAAEASTGKLVLTPALRVTDPAPDPVADDDVSAMPEDETVAQVEDGSADADADVDVAHGESGAEGLGDSEGPGGVIAEAMAWEDHVETEADDAGPDAAVDMAEDEGFDESAVLHLSDALREDEPETVTEAGADTAAPDLSAPDADMLESAAPEGAVAAEGEDWIMSPAQDAQEDEGGAAAADFVFASSRDGGGFADAARGGVPPSQGAAEMDDTADSIFRDDETLLDEDSLRELVAEIVRQELQGALGERITRNVRKLVRREIHRALTSHELE